MFTRLYKEFKNVVVYHFRRLRAECCKENGHMKRNTDKGD